MKPKEKFFTINNQQIPYTFRQRVINRYGYQQANRIFYQCREKNKIMNYISAGMTKGWFKVQSVAMEKVTQSAIDTWVGKIFRNEKPEPLSIKKHTEPSAIGEIMKGIV